ncbi:hypothetical protein ACX0G9_25260 [Flavitalea flava]
MTTLIFLVTLLTLFITLLELIVKAIRRRPFKKSFRLICYIVAGYSLVWLGFFLTKTDHPVPMGSDACFDDWCATVNRAERQPSASQDSITIILHVTMSNHARGIAQKPSEPRIYIIDGEGHTWAASTTQPITLDSKLELHESKETNLAYALPATKKKLKAVIKEGPWITNLLFPEDQIVFTIP